MATDRDKILVIEIFPLDADGVEQEAIYLSSVPWSTAPADSPASKPATAIIDPASFTWGLGCFEFTAEGLFLPGGETRYQSSTASVWNRIDEADYTAPLDVLASLVFEDSRAVLYLSDADTSGGEPTLDIALSDLDEWTHARVEAFDIEAGSDGRAAIRLGAPETMDTEATWWAWRGFDKASRSTSASRPDHSALRDDTTSHTWKIIGRWPVAATGTWFNSPLFRIRDTTGTNTIIMQFLNAAGAWASGGSGFAVSTSGYYCFHAVYDVSDDSFRVYVDGVLTASTAVAGGLKVGAAAAAATWNNIGGSTWGCAGAQHYAAALTAAEVAADARRGVEEDDRATMTVPFNEGTGSLALDLARNGDVIITGPTWPGTGEGEPAMAETRAPALIGTPFGAPLVMVDSLNGLGTPGYAGERVSFSYLVEKRLRRQPIQTIASASTTLNATNQTITPVPRTDGIEFAQGSQIVLDAYAGGTTPLGNPDVYTISRVIGPAVANPIVTIVTTGIIATETVTTSISDNSDGDFTPAATGAVVIRGGSNVAYPAVVLGTAPTSDLQVSMAINSGDSSISAIDHTLQQFGSRESSPTIAREDSTAKLYQHGWRAEGGSRFGDLVHMIARSSFATNGDGPLGVYYSSAGALAARGMWLDMQASDDVYIPPDAVLGIVELQESKRARPGKVTAFYQKNWSPIDAPSSGSSDRLEAELQKPGRSVDAGTGRSATVETSLSFYPHARRKADSLLRLQGFRVYLVRVRGPLPASTIRAVTNGPFLQTSISWPTRSTWQTARTGIIVGATARPFAREGEPALELQFATEV